MTCKQNPKVSIASEEQRQDTTQVCRAVASTAHSKLDAASRSESQQCILP